MNLVERGALWIAALAVFVVVNPMTGMDGRQWQEIVLLCGGLSVAAVALSGASLLSAASLWVIYSAAAYKGPGALNAVLLLLCSLALYALARRHGAARLLVAVALVNVVAWALQAAGAWLPLLRLFAPDATVTVVLADKTWVGLTSSTGDLACILAMALPFTLAAHWAVAVAVLVALLSTSALSGIVAGLLGLGVALWPRVGALRGKYEQLALGALGLMILGIGADQKELSAAWADERWYVWGEALSRWFQMRPLDGFGLGAWAAGNMSVFDSVTREVRVWKDMHFDLLQAGYDLGLIGVALIVGAFSSLSWNAWRNRNDAALGALVAMAVCQFGHFPFRLAGPLAVAALVAGEAAKGGCEA